MFLRRRAALTSEFMPCCQLNRTVMNFRQPHRHLTKSPAKSQHAVPPVLRAPFNPGETQPLLFTIRIHLLPSGYIVQNGCLPKNHIDKLLKLAKQRGLNRACLVPPLYGSLTPSR